MGVERKKAVAGRKKFSRVVAKARQMKPKGGGAGLEVRLAFVTDVPPTAEQLAAEGALDEQIKKVDKDWEELEQRIKARKEPKS